MDNALLDLTRQLLKKQTNVKFQFSKNTGALQAQAALLSACTGPRGWIEMQPVMQAANAWLAGGFQGKGLDWVYLSHAFFIAARDGNRLADSQDRLELILQGMTSWMNRHPQNYYHCYKGVYQAYQLCDLPYVLTHQSPTGPIQRVFDFLQAGYPGFLEIAEQLQRDSLPWRQPGWFTLAQEIAKLQKELGRTPESCEALYEIAGRELGKLPLPAANENWRWLDSWQFGLLRKWYTQTIITRFFELAGSRLQTTGRCAPFWTKHWKQIDDLKIIFERKTQLKDEPKLLDLQQMAHGRFEWTEQIDDGAALLIQLGDYTVIEFFDERTPARTINTLTGQAAIPALPHRDSPVLSWETRFERRLAKLVDGFKTA